MMSIEQNLKVRGQILRVVRNYGTQGISYEGIERVFHRAGKLGMAAILEENLNYLADKGYVRRELVRDQLANVERWVVSITAQGIDLLDGVIPRDPGVETVD